MLSKRHFEALAIILREERRVTHADPAGILDSLERRLVKWCQQENSSFDAGQFKATVRQR